jgi:hypothetical protein
MEPSSIARALVGLLLLVACNHQPSGRPATVPPAATGGEGGAAGAGGAGGGAGGAGGAISNGGAGGAPADAATASSDAAPDRASDLAADSAPRSSDGGIDGFPDSDFLPGRPDIRLCKKEWTAEQCCAFLCGCLNTICVDSAKAKPGLGTCMSWCPKISDMARRCHVYHCYISISPTGGINDHDSHCGHAANEVQGGGCPTSVYQ